MTELLDSTNSDSANVSFVKRCTCCEKFLKFEEFYPSKTSKDGMLWSCKKCCSDRSRAANKIRRRKALEALALLPEPERPEGYVSRADAKSKGLKLFYTGEPCVNGHIAERRVSGSGRCMECCAQDRKAKGQKPRVLLKPAENGWFTAAPCPKCGDTRRKRTRDCPTCLNKRSREFHKRDRVKNPEKYKKLAKDNYEKHRGLFKVHARIRKKRVKQATPDWMIPMHGKEMAEIYGNVPEGYDVDHIVPLAGGRKICGLNLPWNLQYLKKEENREKSNKFPYGEESERLAIRHPSVAALYGVAWSV